MIGLNVKLRSSTRPAAENALFWCAPLVTIILVVTYVARHEFAVDFQHQYWVVGHRLLHGGSPYAWSRDQIASGVGAFPYPALAAVTFVPFGLLPGPLAAALWVAGSMASVVAALRVLWVRDWRLYLLAFLWWPVIIGWQSGNMTLLLVLLVALVWRYRDNPILSGLLTALLISLKPFVWPIGLWLLATRRYRASAWALVTGLALNLIAWWLVGFGQLTRYLQLDSTTTSVLHRYGYGLIALATRAGLDSRDGTALMVGVIVALMAICMWLGRERREAAALVIAIDLGLAASPLVWIHYLTLLIVPLAILRPRLSWEWLLPLVLWLCPGELLVSEWQAILALLATFVLSYLLLRRPPRPEEPDRVSVSDQRRSGQAYVLAAAPGGERAGQPLAARQTELRIELQ